MHNATLSECAVSQLHHLKCNWLVMTVKQAKNVVERPVDGLEIEMTLSCRPSPIQLSHWFFSVHLGQALVVWFETRSLCDDSLSTVVIFELLLSAPCSASSEVHIRAEGFLECSPLALRGYLAGALRWESISANMHASKIDHQVLHAFL